MDAAIAAQNVTAEALTALVEASVQGTEVDTRIEQRSVLAIRDLAMPPEQASRTLQGLLCDEATDCTVAPLTSPLRRLQVVAQFLWTSVLTRGPLDIPSVDLDAVPEALGTSVNVTLQSLRITVRAASTDTLQRLPDTLADRLDVQVVVVSSVAPSSSYPTLLTILVASLAAAYLATACRALVPSGREGS